MEQWSILSNVVNYIEYYKYPKNFHNLDIKAVNQRNLMRRPNMRGEANVRVRFWRHA